MNGDPVNLLHDYSYTSHKVELGIPGYRRGVRISPTGRAYVLRGACGERLYENSQQRGAQVVTQGHEYTLASNGEAERPHASAGSERSEERRVGKGQRTGRERGTE